MVILVTGASGQLGQALKSIASEYETVTFVWADSSEGDLTDPEKLQSLFAAHQPDICINAAAYTAVDKAESEPEKAFAINADGAQNLAHISKENDTTLIHVSTDFVFDGNQSRPYQETDATNPTGVYGLSKLKGEQLIQGVGGKYFIVRTSWVYSDFGNNFKKTMLRLASERDSLRVVNDQIGTPTHAVDLARALITIALSGQHQYGIYHFSNEGLASWYDFAKEIFRINDVSIDLTPIPTIEFPTPAKRPAYSVLDKAKIKAVFGIQINDWKQALLPTTS